jgi:hypothetical protein
VPKATKATKAHKVFKEYRDYKEFKDHRESKAKKVTKVTKVTKVMTHRVISTAVLPIQFMFNCELTEEGHNATNYTNKARYFGELGDSKSGA